jgi:F0F1-type ATP synthase membrane subunit b/b'
MLWAVFKFAYRKANYSLTKTINDTTELLGLLEKKKFEAEKQLNLLKKELKEANDNIEKSLVETECEAKKIIEKANNDAIKLVKKKEEEYSLLIEKIQMGFSAELQDKLIAVILEKLIQKLRDSKKNENFQNATVENSMEMLRNLIRK